MLNGVQEAGGSNPLTQTTKNPEAESFQGFCLPQIDSYTIEILDYSLSEKYFIS